MPVLRLAICGRDEAHNQDGPEQPAYSSTYIYHNHKNRGLSNNFQKPYMLQYIVAPASVPGRRQKETPVALEADRITVKSTFQIEEARDNGWT